MLLVALTSCGTATGILRAQDGEVSDIAPGTAVRVKTYRLKIAVWERRNEGLLVARVTAGGPATDMRQVGDDSVQGALEPRDIITAVDGKPVRSLDDYYRAMHESRANGGRVILTVRDTNTGRTMDWKVQAVEVESSTPLPDSNQTARRIHVVLCGLTGDARLGEAIGISLQALEETLRSNVLEEYLSVLHVVKGDDCNADKVLATVRSLQVTGNDTVFVYYAGHGAYDPNRASDDPSGGHFFQIPNGDLMRKNLLAAMREKGPRLAVLISDTCNVKAYAQPRMAPVFETRAQTIIGNTPLEELLLLYRGIVDVSASSRDQFSWFSTPVGGWFTSALCPTIESQRSWNDMLDSLSMRSDGEYQNLRKLILEHPAGITAETLRLLEEQEHMIPQAFQRDIQEDRTGFTAPQQERTLVTRTSRIVPR